MSQQQYQIQEYSAVQDYLAGLFEGLTPPITPDTLRNSAPHPLLRSIIQQNTVLGKKIIQLSDKFTSKYRQDHYIDRKQFQSQINTIYTIILDSTLENLTIQQKLQKIIESLQRGGQSRISHNFIQKSQERKERRQSKGKVVLEESRKTLQEMEKKQSGRQSTVKVRKIGKPKEGKDIVSIKQVLQVKSILQDEEYKLRDFFEKLRKIMDSHKVNTMNIEHQKLKYTKIGGEATQNILELVRVSSERNCLNLNNLMSMVDLISDTCLKRLKGQGLAESRLQIYLKEIDRREQVYSYAVSKMLEHLAYHKSTLRTSKNSQMCITEIQNLEEIARRFYDLYPSLEGMKNLNIEKRDRTDRVGQTKNQGVQVTLGKTQPERKPGIQAFKLQVKMTQYLERFQKTMKHKKVIECREIQKLFETLRESMPRTGLPTEVGSYQEQLRRLLDLSQKNQKQLGETYNKRAKRLEKRISQLQILVSEAQQEVKAVQEQRQIQRKKQQKKIESERNEMKKVVTQKQALEKNIAEMLRDIDLMKQSVRNQSYIWSQKIRKTEEERQASRQQADKFAKKMSQSLEELKSQRQKMNEERGLYKQKIILLQSREEESKGVKVQLQMMIGDNSRLRQQLEEMTVVYEQKIKEVEDMIQNIKELQKLKRSHQNEIQELQQSLKILKESLKNEEQQIQRKNKQIEKIKNQRNNMKDQNQRYREIGLLNDSDIRILKEEMDKISKAYLDTEEQLEQTKAQLANTCIHLQNTIQEKERISRQKARTGRAVQEVEAAFQALRANMHALQVSQKGLRQELLQGRRQSALHIREREETKKQLNRINKELAVLREQNGQQEKDLREVRQELQRKKEIDSLQGGKRRIQVQALKVEVRKKSEAVEKQKEHYEEKISMLNEKIKDMQQFITQKQLLARITNTHQTQ